MNRNEVQNDHQQARDEKDYKVIVLLALGLSILAWRGLDNFFYSRSISASHPEKIPLSSLHLSRSQEFVLPAAAGGQSLIHLSEATPHTLPQNMRPFLFMPVSINKADRKLLETIPGIGPHLSAKIVSHRAENGHFVTFQELLKIHGIGEKKLAAIQEHTIL